MAAVQSLLSLLLNPLNTLTASGDSSTEIPQTSLSFGLSGRLAPSLTPAANPAAAQTSGGSALLAGLLGRLQQNPLLGSADLSPGPTTPPTEQFQTEISTTVRVGNRLFIYSSGGGSTLQISDGSNPAAIRLLGRTTLNGYTSQSVASFGNLLAVALAPSDYSTNGGRGIVRFYRVQQNGSLQQLADVQVGYLPDSIAFNANGTRLVVANEGEPISGYASDPSKDPAGSIGIIEIQGLLIPRFNYTELDFASVSLPADIRISGPLGTTQATDIEPEYVAILGNTAYVTLQENNGVAKVNLTTKKIEKVFALGTVDYSNQAVDLSDKDGASASSTFAPKLGQAFEGLRMPDGIAAFRLGFKDYFVTANEGDGRDGAPWSPYSDETRGTNPGSGSTPDSTAYRLKRLTDDASVGRADRTTSFGGRSISVFDGDTGALLWDSGTTLQTIAVAAGVYDDLRSDDKGVEPEGIVVTQLNGRQYAIVGMERSKSTMLAVFDITNPSAGRFVTSAVVDGSLSPEGLHIIEAQNSTSGRPQLLLSNEVSNTLNVLDLQTLIASPPVAGAGTFQGTMFKDVAGGSTLNIRSLLTIGEFTNGLTPGSSVYAPPGILDGLGAYDNGDGTFTVLANHEISSANAVPYQVQYAGNEAATTAPINIAGARISKFIVDKDIDDNPLNGYQSRIISGGLAYSTVIGSDNNGFDRFCSSTLFKPGQFGGGRGFADRLYITGEESNGSLYVLDPASGVLREAPALGKGSWENAALVDTGSVNTVGVLLFDDTKAPLYLWVGTKNAGSDLLDRNGLRTGNLYAWAPDSGVIPEAGTDPTPGPDSDDLKAINSGTALAGSWKLLGDQTFVIGKSAADLRAAAVAAGAMQFSRPEDGDTNPLNGKQVVFNTTGSGDFSSGDKYGNVIMMDFASAFSANGQLNGPGSTTLKVIYDGDKLSDPTTGLRSPDNLTWSADGFLYVQEDRAVSPWGSVDGSIWKLSAGQVDPVTGQAAAERWAVIDRKTPYGQTDSLAIGANFANSGEWESSGIIDVSGLYGAAAGSFFLADVQAHGLKDGNLWGNGYLAEGGQLTLIQQSNGGF